jgi:uncharacterized RDD family membrane protein YckC
MDLNTVSINTAFNVQLEFEYAAFHKRLFAYLIDLGLLVIYLYVAKYFVSMLYDGEVYGEHSGSQVVIDLLVVTCPMFLYSLIMETALNGQTLGKKIMKIRVISLEGGEPTLGQFILRWITKFFEWPLLFGYIYSWYVIIIYQLMFVGVLGIVVVIVILITKKKQRLGDIAAGTTVVEAITSLNISDTIFKTVSNTAYQVTYPEVMRLTDNDINTINNVIAKARKTHNYDTCMRVEYKIKEVLSIQSKESSIDFLEKLIEDYNYLATKE